MSSCQGGHGKEAFEPEHQAPGTNSQQPKRQAKVLELIIAAFEISPRIFRCLTLLTKSKE